VVTFCVDSFIEGQNKNNEKVIPKIWIFFIYNRYSKYSSNRIVKDIVIDFINENYHCKILIESIWQKSTNQIGSFIFFQIDKNRATENPRNLI
jgi:hypothetical protein